QPTSIEPGAAAIIELRLARPVAVTRGDAFIIRRPSPPLTLGGGVILDPAWPRRRGRRLDAALTALSGGDLEAIRFWTEDAGPSGVSTTTIAQRLGMNRAHVEGMLRQLEGDSKVLQARTPQSNESTWLTPSAFRAVRTRAKKVLADHFGRDRLAENMSKAEAVERILPGKAAALADVYLDWLAAERIVVIDSGHVSQPGRTAQLSGEESRLAQQLISVFEQGGLTPPSPGELAQATGAKPQIIDGVMRYLQQAGKILQLPGGLLVAASAVATVRRELTASGDSEFGVGDFKQRFGLSRKWAIPLLEHLDSIGFTRRVGNTRQIVKTSKQKGT
ncbi:MAG: SelB C-terminal domain-containing protein, partial [Acidobacteriota bacterium]|nr:SelB C-terminal domain-containing protein [Acidobacteriota bacterium]